MTRPFRRDACPSLSAPMQTGDGLLVRLTTEHCVVSTGALAGLACAAEAHGNGLLEITRRGSLQIRGLTANSAPKLADDVSSLDLSLTRGVLQIGPLAGLDPMEIADPRPLSASIDAGIATLEKALAAKVSVVVDGGGHFLLDDVLADFRLTATKEGWLVGVGGMARTARYLGLASEAQTAQLVIRGLRMLTEKGPHARARELTEDELEDLKASLLAAAAIAPTAASVQPIGVLRLRGKAVALCLRLPFGQAAAAQFAKLAKAASELQVAEFRMAPGNALLALCPTASAASQLIERARDIGFIVSIDDPRLQIIACAGAPNCASGQIGTKALAAAVANLDARVAMHISGCEKRCAEPAYPTNFSIVGTAQGTASIEDHNGRLVCNVAEGAALDAFRHMVRLDTSDKRPGDRLATKRRNAEKRPDQFAGVGDRG